MVHNTMIQCLIVDDEPLAREVVKAHVSKIDFLTLAGECSNALEANSFLHEQAVDLLFLDINMPHLSGIDFVKQMHRKPAIIFTTAYSEHALKGYELDAIDYLMKPITFNRVFKAANKALVWLGRTELQSGNPTTKKADKVPLEPPFLFLKASDRMVKVPLEEIIAVESQGHYVKIYTPTKNYVIHQSISEMEQRLPEHDFFRTHRSFIIGLKHIQAFSANNIETMKAQVPIGRSYKKEVMRRLNLNFNIGKSDNYEAPYKK